MCSTFRTDISSVFPSISNWRIADCSSDKISDVIELPPSQMLKTTFFGSESKKNMGIYFLIFKLTEFQKIFKLIWMKNLKWNGIPLSFDQISLSLFIYLLINIQNNVTPFLKIFIYSCSVFWQFSLASQSYDRFVAPGQIGKLGKWKLA